MGLFSISGLGPTNAALIHHQNSTPSKDAPSRTQCRGADNIKGPRHNEIATCTFSTEPSDYHSSGKQTGRANSKVAEFEKSVGQIRARIGQIIQRLEKLLGCGITHKTGTFRDGKTAFTLTAAARMIRANKQLADNSHQRISTVRARKLLY